MTDRQRLATAFKMLQKQHYVTRTNFSCCGSCASYEIGQFMETRPKLVGHVTWNRQSDDAFRAYGRGRGGYKDNMLHSPLFLGWSGDPAVIVAELTAAGLKVQHDGSTDKCIEVMPFDRDKAAAEQIQGMGL